MRFLVHRVKTCYLAFCFFNLFYKLLGMQLLLLPALLNLLFSFK
jgi:hypothetical protein